MKKNKIKVFRSYEENQKDSDNATYNMKPRERIAAIERLRREYFHLIGKPVDLRVKKIVEIVKIID